MSLVKLKPQTQPTKQTKARTDKVHLLGEFRCIVGTWVCCAHCSSSSALNTIAEGDLCPLYGRGRNRKEIVKQKQKQKKQQNGTTETCKYNESEAKQRRIKSEEKKTKIHDQTRRPV